VGLDIVEFIMEIQETFGINISDPHAQQLNTPRRCIDYVCAHVPHSSDDFCMSQRAFYQLRRVLMQKTNLPRSCFQPNTNVMGVLPEEGRDETWSTIGTALGANKRWWPELPVWRWFPRQVWFPRNLRALVKLLVVHYPPAVFATEPVPGTRAHITRMIYALIRDNFAVDMSQYSDDARFTEDMGIE
jgi:hypothetical protein